jgi:hypothetical protein
MCEKFKLWQQALGLLAAMLQSVPARSPSFDDCKQCLREVHAMAVGTWFAGKRCEKRAVASGICSAGSDAAISACEEPALCSCNQCLRGVRAMAAGTWSTGKGARSSSSGSRHLVCWQRCCNQCLQEVRALMLQSVPARSPCDGSRHLVCWKEVRETSGGRRHLVC